MGLFLTVAVNQSASSTAAAAITSENLFNNFLIFIMILAVRIAINQSLQRFDRNNR